MDNEASREEAALLNRVRTRLTDYGQDRANLLPILRMIQDTLHYIPKKAVHMAADHLEMASSEVFGVATFYNQFKFNPPGKYPIKVCLGTACHVKGGDIILENFERKLDIHEGETTPDREFSLERVACVGCCALAPVALVGESVHGHMAPSKIEGLFTRIQVEKEMAEREKRRHEPAR